MSNKMSDPYYWDGVWEEERALPIIFKPVYHPYYVDILHRFFKRYLPQKKALNFIELGAAPASWMHYFYSEFGYNVSGIEYSDEGFFLGRKNIELLNFPANFYKGDIFSFQFPIKYDIVFSAGLIEHFDPPFEIVKKHLDITKPGGYCVIGVPNIKKSFYGKIQKLFDTKSLRTYKDVSKDDLYEFFSTQEAKVIACTYVGVFSLHVLYLPSSKPNIIKIIRFIQTLLDRVFKILDISQETRIFSPYIFIIYKKNV